MKKIILILVFFISIFPVVFSQTILFNNVCEVNKDKAGKCSCISSLTTIKYSKFDKAGLYNFAVKYAAENGYMFFGKKGEDSFTLVNFKTDIGITCLKYEEQQGSYGIYLTLYPSTELTDNQIAEMQQLVSDIGCKFVASILKFL